MNDQQATATEIEKLTGLLQQAINENDKDNVQIQLWNMDILFKQLKTNHLKDLTSSTNDEVMHQAHKTYKDIEAVILNAKNEADRYLMRTNPFEKYPRSPSSRGSTSPSVKSNNSQTNNIDEDRDTAASQDTGAPSITSTVLSDLPYRQTVLDIQQHKARMEDEINNKQIEQLNRHKKEKRKLRMKTEEEYRKLDEELQRLIKEAKQRKKSYKEEAYQQKQEMKHRHNEEKRNLKRMKQELEFETEQRFIEAEKTVLGYNEESRKEMHQRFPKIDMHEINKAALPIRVHKSATADSELEGNALQLDTQVQSLASMDQQVLPNENGQLNANAFVQRILDLMQAPPADLIIFDGNPRKFHLFLKAFDSAVHSRSLDDCAKLTRLPKYCSGEPKSLVESFMVLEPTQGYLQARAMLERRYGDKFVITKAWADAILDRQPIKAKDALALRKYADDLQAWKLTLNALGHSCMAEMNTSSILIHVIGKLPSYLQDRWRMEVQDIRLLKQPTFEDIVAFTEKAAEEANDPVYGLLGREKTTPGASTFSTSAQPTQLQRQCQVCQESHSIFHCKTFKRMKPLERLNLANERRLCINCLKPGHQHTECYSQRVCPIEDCGQRHTIFLHI